MRTVRVSTLLAGQWFNAPLFGRDGEVVLLACQELDPVTLRALKDSGIDALYLCETPAEARDLRSRAGHEEVPVSSLAVGERLPWNLYSEDGRMVLAAGQRIQQGHLDLFQRRSLKAVYRQYGGQELGVKRFRELLKQFTAEELLSDTLHGALEISRRNGPSIAANWGTLRPNERAPHKVVDAHHKHVERLATVAQVFQILKIEGRLDLPILHDLARDIVEDTAADRLLLLAFAGSALHGEYLADHSLGTAIFSVVIGAMAGYAPQHLLDIALGALLHDIGMTAVPQELVERAGPLSDEEREFIQRHPEEGFRILNDVAGIDRHVHYMVFQSHERFGGQGYPRRRSNKLIHEYARILALADTFQALITPRPYRERLLPVRAMEKILHLTRERYFDPVLARLFLTASGLFPVGSWVKLNTGFIARVVDPGGGDYTRPLVSIVFDREGRHLERPIILDLASCKKTRIDEPLDDERVGLDIVAGFHANGPVLPGLSRKPEETERWLVPGEMMDWSASFQGSLGDFRIIDVIQLLDLAQKNGILVVKSPELDGRIYFDGGAIVRAEAGSQQDEEAVYRMLALSQGTFSFVQKAVAVPRTVRMSNTSILLEALRRHDEKTRVSG